MTTLILTLNAGSSSLKFAVFGANPSGSPTQILRGQITGASSSSRVTVTGKGGEPLLDQSWPSRQDAQQNASALLELVAGLDGGGAVTAVGHRIVHGGRRFRGPELVSESILQELEELKPLAPLHQPLGLAPVKALIDAYPELPQVCCFDTAFHHDLAPPVSRYAIPRRFEEKGLRRYGFHGLSYQYIAERLRQDWPYLAGARVIAAHLGSGASLCALRDGHSVDTTMGFSALDGLVMATRPGSIDPGILLHLQRSEGLSVDELEHLLYHECGLLGVSGESGDVRALLSSSSPAAVEALELFAFSIARHVAALTATLGGLDAVVFTGGVGEHSAQVRKAVAERLRWMGLELDLEANDAGRPVISLNNSRVRALVIPTDEEQVIAQQTLSLL